MKSKISVFGAIIILVACQNNISEFLVEKGYQPGLVLSARSFLTLILSSFFCIMDGESILPKNLQLQFVRMLNSGVAIYMSMASLAYLSASTASILQRLDIPLVVLFSLFLGFPMAIKKVWVSIASVMLVLLFVGFYRRVDESIEGFILAIISACLLSWGFLFLKKLTTIENRYVLINMNCIGTLMISLTVILIDRPSLTKPDTTELLLFLGSGIVQYLLYLCTHKIYKAYPVDYARFPFVIGSLTTIILEGVIEQKYFGTLHMTMMTVLIIMISAIVLIGNPKTSRDIT